jgi:hypothetical protein
MSLLAVFAAEEHELAPMLMDPVWFGVVAGAVFLLLGFVTWSFRDVANRHSHKSGAAEQSDLGHERH